MKTESQTVSRLESVVNEFNRLADMVPQDAKEIPPETAQQISFCMGALVAIGWVLDCEDEIKTLTAKINLAAGIARLQSRLAGPAS